MGASVVVVDGGSLVVVVKDEVVEEEVEVLDEKDVEVLDEEVQDVVLVFLVLVGHGPPHRSTSPGLTVKFGSSVGTSS